MVAEPLACIGSRWQKVDDASQVVRRVERFSQEHRVEAAYPCGVAEECVNHPLKQLAVLVSHGQRAMT